MTVQPGSTAIEITARMLILAGCFVVTLAHFVMEPFRWNRCYQPADCTRRTQSSTRDALLCTALATYILPFKLGIPLRVYLLRRKGDLTLHLVGVVIALDGLISLVIWTTIAAFCAWTASLRWKPPGYLWVAVSAAVLVCLVVVVLQRQLGARMLQRLRNALTLLDRPWKRISCSAMILLVDVMSYGLRHALLLLLITDNARDMPVVAAVGIIATFTGIISGLPMGLVGYDATLIALLAVVGIHPEQALLMALINRALNLVAAAALGIPAAMRMGLGSSVGSIISKFREIANDKP